MFTNIVGKSTPLPYSCDKNNREVDCASRCGGVEGTDEGGVGGVAGIFTSFGFSSKILRNGCMSALNFGRRQGR